MKSKWKYSWHDLIDEHKKIQATKIYRYDFNRFTVTVTVISIDLKTNAYTNRIKKTYAPKTV